MSDENIELFIDFTSTYSTDKVFAMRVDQFMNKFKGKQNREITDTPKSNRDLLRMEFEKYVLRFTFMMQEHMNLDYTDKTYKAMMFAFDNDEKLTWFTPRNSEETINIPCFCRLLYHLNKKGFFNFATCCGKKMNIESIAHLLVGHTECKDSCTSDPDKSVIDEEKLKRSTILTYIKQDSGIPSFEKFCKEHLRLE